MKLYCIFLAKHAKINTISAHTYKFKMPKKKLENKHCKYWTLSR